MISFPIVISSHVINCVKSLPETDRQAIVNALAESLLLGMDPEEKLSLFQSLLYFAIFDSVRKDSIKVSRCMEKVAK